MSAMNFRNRLFSLLAEEFGNYIPQFKPYTLDYQMVVYASKDLEIWLKVKLNTEDTRTVYRKIEEHLRIKPIDLRASINFWAGIWLRKWRERVRVLSTKFEMPKDYMESIRAARKVYQHMDYKSDLKNMAIRKLINHGEICMVEFIAENLIVEEISKRIRKPDKDIDVIAVDPLRIYNAISARISRLPREKGPLVYLNMRPNVYQ
ncbi:MAG: hypothetical protein N3E47_03600 [Candidatus Bathyarchaeota archaeon]|nr:hypothetical protein [Candidatus Bathyarchaeota archaeon]